MADMDFFATHGRVFRAGEGAVSTGLKASGNDFGPSIPAPGKAMEIEDTNLPPNMLLEKTERDVREHFEGILAEKECDQHDLQAGRAAVGHFPEALTPHASAAPGKE